MWQSIKMLSISCQLTPPHSALLYKALSAMLQRMTKTDLAYFLQVRQQLSLQITLSALSIEIVNIAIL